MFRLLLLLFFLHQTYGYGVRVKADVDIGDDTGLGSVVRQFMQKYLKDGEAEIDISEMIQHLQQLASTEGLKLDSNTKKEKSKHQKDNDPRNKDTKTEKHEVDQNNEEQGGEIEQKLKKKHESKKNSKDSEEKNHDSKKTRYSKIENIVPKKLKHHRDSKGNKKVDHNDKETEQHFEKYHLADSFSDDSEEISDDSTSKIGSKNHYSTKKNKDFKNTTILESDEYSDSYETSGRRGQTKKSLKKSVAKYIDSSKENEKGEIDKVKAGKNKENENSLEELKGNIEKVHIFGIHEGAKVKDPLNKIKV